MLHMLDTDTAGYIIKERSPAISARVSAIPPSLLCVSVMTRAELQYGLRRLPAGHRLHVGVREFLRIVRVLPWDADAADYCAEIRHQLVTTGQAIGEMDMNDRRTFAGRQGNAGDEQGASLRAYPRSGLGQLE
jgi:tRNA(fMet)-specific endonuclease VapC